MKDLIELKGQIRRLIDCGFVASAEEALRELDLASDEASPLRELLGLSLRQQERWTEAAAEFESAGLCGPISLEAQFALAECYLQIESRQAAHSILVFLAVQERLPEIILPNLAAKLGAVGEYNLALSICRQSAANDPDNDQPLYGMAYYMNKLRYPAETILPVVLRASELSPEETVYRVAGAMLAERAGNPEQAFRLIRDLSLEQLAGLGCSRCLGRLLTLYDACGDRERPQLIRDIIASRGPSSPGCRHDRE